MLKNIFTSGKSLLERAPSFFMGGAWMPFAVLAGAISIYGIGYTKGRIDASKNCHMAELRLTVKSLEAAKSRLELQAKISSQALRAAGDRSNQDSKALEIAEQQALKIEQDMERRLKDAKARGDKNEKPKAQCIGGVISSSDARRLRQIK